MKREIIISLVIIIFIVMLDIISNSITNDKIAEMISMLDDFRQSIENQENIEESLPKAEKIKEKWEEYGNLMGYYIEHDEIEKAGIEISNLYSYCKSGEKNEELKTIYAVEFWLEHIEEKHAVKLNNFF